MISRDDWLRAVADAIPRDDVDPDALTVAEFAEMTGCANCTARRKLQRMEREGKVRRVAKIVYRVGSGATRAPAYRLVQP